MKTIHLILLEKPFYLDVIEKDDWGGEGKVPEKKLTRDRGRGKKLLRTNYLSMYSLGGPSIEEKSGRGKKNGREEV